MKRTLTLCMLLCSMLTAGAQRVLSLDSCRSLALDNNKQIAVSKLSKEMANENKKAMRTKYLPKIDATGTYQYTSRELSLLNDHQKSVLSGLGTDFGATLSGNITSLAKQGIITKEQAQQLGGLLQTFGAPVVQALDKVGQKVVDAFRTDTRHIFGIDVSVSQPIYMGGAIIAANKMASLGQDLAEANIETRTQATIYEIDQTYWLVVSLRQKQKLADSFLELVQKLDHDVQKMIDEGVATRADGLKVAVKVNEAEMAKTQVDDGYVLAKMLLCQLCGIGIDEDVKLADEESPVVVMPELTEEEPVFNYSLRPELRMLSTAVDISKQNTNLVRAAYLPHVAAFGGYMASSPSIYNGFENKFKGMFHVGVMVHLPVWNWLEGVHKVKATRAAHRMAQIELDDAREKMSLQVRQNTFKVKEANRKLALAQKSIQSAEENLRCANIGFAEGVMQSTEVLLAQTAWHAAHSQKIDAEIGVRLANLNLNKSLGTLQ